MNLESTKGERNRNAELREHQIVVIRLAAGVVPKKEIAKYFNTTESYISLLWSNHRWRSVKCPKLKPEVDTRKLR